MANATTPPHGIRPLLTVDDLAAILRRAKSTILADLRRAPQRVPRTCTPPGTRRPLWRPEDVEAWLQAAAEQLPTARKKRRRIVAEAAILLAAAPAEASARVLGARATPPGEPAQPGPEASA